jgi:hypothetical protein
MMGMRRRGSSCSADPSQASPAPPAVRRRLVATVAALAVLAGSVLLGPSPVEAESPLVVAEELAVDGVYIAPSRSEIDEAAIAESIRQARARGLRLVVVAPVDPQPSSEAFARRVLEASDADAALVFPTEGGLDGHVIDELESASLRALSAGRAASTPPAAVDAFTEELLTEPERSLPPIIGQVVRWVLVLAILLAGAVAIEQLLRRMFPKKRIAPVDADEQQRPERDPALRG